MGKVHSQEAANELLRLGWTLRREFRAEGDPEPYEYFFVWEKEGDPVWLSKDSRDWGRTPKTTD
jgi:hypothetical protein